MFRKHKRVECKKYLDWVKTLPCRVTMQDGCDAHHLIDVLPSGMGTKVHDWFVLPLSREPHTELHRYGAKDWEYKTSTSQSDEVIKTLNQAINEGLIEIRWVGK